MPALLTSSISTSTYTRASDLPPQVWLAFKNDERGSNIMYPHAAKSRLYEQRGSPTPGQVWICVWTNRPGFGDTLDFVLSCTTGLIDNYPVFIFSTVVPQDLSDDFLSPRMSVLIDALRAAVPVERVFSVFASTPVTMSFTTRWSEVTGVGLATDPEYYRATFSACTRASFKPRRPTADPHFQLRRAVPEDLADVAELCRLFAEDSEPFTLSYEEAWREAEEYISKDQIWVHTISNGYTTEIASIVAVTRTSPKVAAITKVFTNPQWRGRRCAERLVRHVCQQLLISEKKEAVVLYVALAKPAARKVYRRVGFAGLEEAEGILGSADEWLELGFDITRVDLGHW